MMYVIVKEDTKDRLHLRRDPSLQAWGILVGLISLGFGAAFYSEDYLVWKLAYISGAVFVGLSCMEDWEDCVFDRVCGTVMFQRQSLIQKLFHATKGQKIVVDQLSNISTVHVQEEVSEGHSACYTVVLNFSTGYSLPVTETATRQDKSQHEQVAGKIRNFLELPSEGDITVSPVMDEATGVSAEDNSSSSDEGFERIDRAELVDEGSRNLTDTMKHPTDAGDQA